MRRPTLLVAAALAVAYSALCAGATPLSAASTTPLSAATATRIPATAPSRVATTSSAVRTEANGAFCRRAMGVQQAALAGLVSLVGGAGAVLPDAPLSCGPAAPASAAHTGSTYPPRAARSDALHGGAARAAHTGGQPLHLPAYVPLGSSPSGAMDTGGLLGLAAKFAAVLVLLFLCLRVLRLVLPRLSGGGTTAAGGMVLHSETIADKQRVQLLDLDVRLVLVAVSGANTTVLTTIDDAAEMAALRARYQPRARGQAATMREQATEGEQAERPSFASALVLATRQKMPHGAARRGAAPLRRPGTRETATPPPPSEPALNRALETMRALRRRAEGL